MTTLDTHAPPAIAPDGPRRTKRRRSGVGGISGPLFVSCYVVLLLVFGVLPTLYAVYLAFTNVRGQFTGVNQFVRVFQDFRFGPAFADILAYLVIWLVLIVVLTVAVAIILRGRMPARLSSVLRFLYYIPGALAGVASILVWLFMLDPDVSPASWLLRTLGLNSFAAMMRSSRFWLAMKFAAQEFFEFFFGQFALSDTTVAKSIHQRQLLIQCRIVQRRFRHGLI